MQCKQPISKPFGTRSLSHVSSIRPVVSRTRSVRVHASAEYDALKSLVVIKAATGEPVELLKLWEPSAGKRVVIPFMTHFADLSSWEYAQKLVKVIPQYQAAGVQVIAVGLGSAGNARKFSAALNFPLDLLYADPEGWCYKALGFAPGFGKDLEISPYAKLLPMLMGIGSEGTIQEVLRGYVGDKSAKPVFEGKTPFDIVGEGYQRPFELATLRLFNMGGVLSKWSELSPPNEQLLVQQGGTVVFDGTDVLYKYKDTGILKYTDIDVLNGVVLKQPAAAAAASS